MLYRYLLAISLLTTPYFADGQVYIDGDTVSFGRMSYKVEVDGGLDQFAGDGSIVVFRESLVIGGLAPDSTVHLSGQTFRQFRVNFVPGPISTDPNSHNFYKNVWTVTQAQIDSFKQGLYSLPPIDIRTWPAHGRSQFNEPYNLAPYVDVNSNGYYDWQNGDYPDIEGDICSIALFNDQAPSSIDSSDGERMVSEGYAMYWAYDDPGVMEQTLFKKVQITNRSGQDYSNVYFGKFIDQECGASYNDLSGTDVARQAFYAYDNEPIDSTPFGIYPLTPYSGSVILAGPKADILDGLDNDWDGCVDGVRDSLGNCVTESLQNNVREGIAMSNTYQYSIAPFNPPLSTMDYYNSVRSIFNNGLPLTIETPSGFLDAANGDGYAPNGGTICNYHFPGNSFAPVGHITPSSPTNWFASPDARQDVKGFQTMGPFTWEDGETISFTSATFWGAIHHTQHGSIIDSIGVHVDSILAFNASNPISIKELRSMEGIRYGQNDEFFFLLNETEDDLDYQIIDIQGRVMHEGVSTSRAREAIPLDALTPGIYILQIPSRSGSIKFIRP